MTRSNGHVGRTLAVLVYIVLAAVLVIAALAQLATLVWFARERLDLNLRSRRSQRGEALLLGGVTVEAICLAAWRLVVLARRETVPTEKAQRCVRAIAIAGGFASAAALWVTITMVTWPGQVEFTFVLLFAGAVVVAGGIALLAIVLGRMFIRAADRAATVSRLRAELDAVI